MTRHPLPEAANVDETEIHVEKLAGLDTPHEFRPNDGILDLGQPVDVVLPDFAGTSIRLSLREREGRKELEQATTIDTGQGPKIKLTQLWLKQALAAMKKDYEKLNQQLAMARAAAEEIETWLKSSTMKPVQLRGIKREQLRVLREQTIPALEKQSSQMQTRGAATQRLSQIVERSHDVATIHLVIRPKNKKAKP